MEDKCVYYLNNFIVIYLNENYEHEEHFESTFHSVLLCS